MKGIGGGNPIYALATGAGIPTVVTSTDSSHDYNADGSTVSAATEARLTTLWSQITAAATSGYDAASDANLRTTLTAGIGYSSMSASDKLLVDYLISSEARMSWSGKTPRLPKPHTSLQQTSRTNTPARPWTSLRTGGTLTRKWLGTLLRPSLARMGCRTMGPPSVAEPSRARRTCSHVDTRRYDAFL